VTRILAALLFLTANTYGESSYPGGLTPTPRSERPRLERMLKDGNWNERINAVNRLGAMGPYAQKPLASALRDADWQVRFTAVHWLGRQGVVSIPSLSAALREDPCRLVRLNAVHWLGSLGPDALPSLEEALLDESGVVRMTDRYWIRKLENNDRAAEPESNPGEELSECKRSVLPLRFTAGLPRFEFPAAENPSPDAASAAPPSPPNPSDSPESMVAKAALARREQFKRPISRAETEREIKRLFGEPERLSPPEGPGERRDQRVSATARILEGEDRPPEHDPIPALLESLENEFPPIRARAADELGWLGAKAGRAVGSLIIALRDESPRVRGSAALALGNIGGPAEGALEQLKRALKDPSADVRYSAAVALGRIGTPSARQAFSHYLMNEATRSSDAGK